MAKKPFQVRGRFDIVVPFSKEEGGGYMRLTSNKDLSLSRDEIAEELRDLLDRMIPRRTRSTSRQIERPKPNA